MELWARNCPIILPKFRLPLKFRDLLHAANHKINIKDRQIMYNVTIEALSRNYSCGGKVINITYPEGVGNVSYSACNAHAPSCLM